MPALCIYSLNRQLNDSMLECQQGNVSMLACNVSINFIKKGNEQWDFSHSFNKYTAINKVFGE